MRKMFFGLLCLLLWAGCDKDEPTAQVDEIKNFNPSELEQEVLADETSTGQAFSFTTGGAWYSQILEVSAANTRSGAEWLRLMPASGDKAGNYQVAIQIQENFTGKPRKAQIEIISGSSKITISVEQKEVNQAGENLGQDELIIFTEQIPVFTEAGGEATIRLQSSLAWHAEVDSRVASWASISPLSGEKGEGTFKITVSPNQTPDERNGSVTVSNGMESKVISFVQKQKDALTVTASRYEISDKGGAFDVEVKANIQFEVKVADDWIGQVKTKGLTTTNLTFQVEPNLANEPRIGTVIVSNGVLKEEIKVYQTQKDVLVISEPEVLVSQTGGVVSVEIKSNVAFEVVMPEQTWVKESITKSLSVYTRDFTVEANPENTSREAVIHFASTDGSNLVAEVKIVQGQKDAIVLAKEKVVVKADGDRLEVKGTANIPITAQITGGWIHPVTTKSMEPFTLSFTVDANPATEKRTGKIVFKGGAQTQTLVVEQEASLPLEKIGEIHIPTAGTLSTLITAKELAQYTSLKITGYLNAEDEKMFTPASNNPFRLTELDVSGVTFEFNTISGFTELASLKKVKLPESLQVLKEQAFTYCTALTEVDFGAAPKLQTMTGSRFQDVFRVHYPMGPFAYCTSLKIIQIPASVEQFEAGTLSGCTALEQVSFAPNSILNILSGKNYTYSNGVTYQTGEQGYFEKCDALKTIQIPASVTIILKAAFKDWASLETLILPDELKVFQTEELFMGCKNLVQVKLPAGANVVGPNMFKGCGKLANAGFQTAIKTIGEYGFYGCTSLMVPDLSQVTSFGEYSLGGLPFTTFTAPQGMTEIPQGLLRGCTQLKTVQLSGVEKIGLGAFVECSSLASVTIPATVKEIGNAAFGRCKTLNEFVLTSGNLVLGASLFSSGTGIWNDGDDFNSIPPLSKLLIPKEITSLTSADGRAPLSGSNIREVVFEEGSTCHTFGICSYADKLTQITLPASIRTLTRSAFFRCSNLRQVTFSEGLETIERGAFMDCKELKNIQLPISLRNIDWEVFLGCGFTSIVIPEGVQTLGEGSFAQCLSLQRVTLPSTLKLIDSYAFSDNSALYECVLNGGDLELGKAIFYNTAITELVVSKNVKSLSGGTKSKPSCLSENIKTIRFETGSACTTITNGVFSHSIVTGITLPASLREIGSSAFANSAELTELVIPPGVTHVGESAFLRCPKLKRVVLPSTLQMIGSSAFADCPVLSECVLNGGDLELGKAIFNNTAMTELIISKNVKSLQGEGLFSSCLSRNITTIKFEANSNCTLLGRGVFADNNITTFTLPPSLKEIGPSTFLKSKELSEIIIPAGVTHIGYRAFADSGKLIKVIFSGPKPQIHADAFEGCTALQGL